MKTYNSPAQARNLKEIETAAVAINLSENDGTIQPLQPAETETPEEEGAETKTQGSSKKAGRKKNITEI